ncbi:MAG: ATP-binding cassette domain-containing protein [Alphaproteobacteria bacterium]|nr:ATP-binding cassette domain-containing protein [Alphaproteobacteria bacterium]
MPKTDSSVRLRHPPSAALRAPPFPLRGKVSCSAAVNQAVGAGASVIALRDLIKRRSASGTTFELSVPALDVPRGGCLALCGESGSGKSTLLDILALASRPDSVKAFALSAQARQRSDVAALWQRGGTDRLAPLRARHLGYVPQTGGLFAFLRVRDNIALPRRLLGMQDDGTVEHLAERLGVADQLRKKPSALSVGQRQRVAIARALAHGPALVLADEPTASVDPATAETVMALLLEQAAQNGAAVVVASHDWARIQKLGLPRLHPRIERHTKDGATLVRSIFDQAHR